MRSPDQLNGYDATSRSRFGPEQLGGLNGEALLETTHAHGQRDSLVYWLEFKNDEEFPARFGGIFGWQRPDVRHHSPQGNE